MEGSIEKVVQAVTYQLVEKRQEIIDILIECASKLPEKLSIYTTLLGILNLRNPNFAENVTCFFFFLLNDFFLINKFISAHRHICNQLKALSKNRAIYFCNAYGSFHIRYGQCQFFDNQVDFKNLSGTC